MIYSFHGRKNALAVFQDKRIRRIWHNNEWWFSVVDVVFALTESDNPRNYWSMLKSRELEHEIELSTFCVQLKIVALFDDEMLGNLDENA